MRVSLRPLIVERVLTEAVLSFSSVSFDCVPTNQKVTTYTL